MIGTPFSYFSPSQVDLLRNKVLELLANFNVETSTGILQITNKIKLQGTINLTQSVITSLIIIAAFVWNGTLQVILIAYRLGKTILGLGMFVIAQVQLYRVLGAGWWMKSFSTLTSVRELIRFAVSSNVSATIIKLFRESELLWVGFFLSTTDAAYYRVAYTIVGLLSIPADPLISTTFPEINRLVVQKAWQHHWQAWLPDKWARIGACETGYGKRPGRWDWNSGTYQGAFGFAVSSWDAFVPRADRKAGPYPSEAYLSTPRQQYEVALAIWRMYGFSGWGCRGA